MNRYSHNPSLLEINGRVWIKRFSGSQGQSTLSEIDSSYIDYLKKNSFDYLWLMGAWQNSEDHAEKYCLVDGLKHEYSEALPDWDNSDVIGSPYAIDEYVLNKRFGKKDDLLKFKEQLNSAGIKLILDFVPNHFSAESNMIKLKPEIFLAGDDELLAEDPETFFTSNGKVFAHGKDPYFAAWQDTIQVNYFSAATYEYLIGLLLELTDLCDGVRCDMAMLPLLDIFESTWISVIQKMNLTRPSGEFWESAISQVKDKKSDFIFIAEAYWDLEYNLQQLGFDYTYDKRLTDRLRNDTPENINTHFLADRNYQAKSVRFLENHDEDRAVTALGLERSKAAAVIISTLPGMRFYHDGQFEGKSARLPVQLGREPEEKVINELPEYYELLLSISSREVCKYGEWRLLDVYQAGSDDFTNRNVLSWVWSNDNENLLVVVNYSAETSYCRIKVNIETAMEQIVLRDLLDNKSYSRSRDEIETNGLFIQLEKFQSHIFLITR